MGFLDNSTNNIILDAVLTDYGRQQLAAGRGNFNITHFALADDEIDYRIIKKYGRAVGKEKIEKNTPIFEALTNPNIALKYKLIARENTGTSITQVFMPILTSNPTSVALTTSATGARTTSQNVTLTLQFRGSTDPAAIGEVAQTAYTINVSDRFCVINNPVNGFLTSPDAARNSVSITDPARMATYILRVDSPTRPVGFTITARNIDQTTASIYGKKTSATERTITTTVTVTGNRHGTSVAIPVTYTLIA